MLRGFAHATKLLDVHLAPDQRGQARGHTVLVPPKLETVLLRHPQSMLTALIQRPVIDAASNSLEHAGIVHDHLLRGEVLPYSHCRAGQRRRWLPGASPSLLL